MNILVNYLDGWGLGDKLCSNPIYPGLKEKFDSAHTDIYINGPADELLYNPFVKGKYDPAIPIDISYDIRFLTHMPLREFAKLESMPSLVDHMCSYADVQPSNKKPQIYLTSQERKWVDSLGIFNRNNLYAGICSDFFDKRRAWDKANYKKVALQLRKWGFHVIEFGIESYLGEGINLVRKTNIRQTAAILERCCLFIGNNSGLFHYAQAVNTPCVTLFSLAVPERYIHEGSHVIAVQASIDCINCVTKDFIQIARRGCLKDPAGLCMTEITVEMVTDAIDKMIATLKIVPTI